MQIQIQKKINGGDDYFMFGNKAKLGLFIKVMN